MPPLPDNPMRRPRLCRVPLPVILKVLDHLDFRSLIAVSRLSKRYSTLITNFRKRELFLIGPPTPSPPHLAITAPPQEEDATEINHIHPIFNHLYFTATNPVSAIRIGSVRGPLLGSLKVKNVFATEPAMREMCIRIISGKCGKVWEGECDIKKAAGITVWELVKQLTRL
jgi:hypothetical protein